MPPEAGSRAGSRFVGRRAEIRALVDELRRLRDGRGGTVLVTGGAGIGKSRLVATVLDRVTHGTDDVERLATGTRVGYGECLPDLVMPPLWPLRRALSSARSQSDPGTGTSTQPLVGTVDGLVELARLLDVAATTSPAAGTAALNPGWDRLAVLGDVADRLVAAASQAPLLLVLEDVHWADPETLALLRLVAPELVRVPLLVVATARPPADDLHATAITGLTGSASTRVVPVGPLTLRDVEEYLSDTEHQDAASVLRLSGGLPLLLPAAVGRADGAGPRQSSAAGLEEPRADVPTLVRRLTVSLSEAHVRVLEAASLVTTGIDAELAAAAAGVPVSAAGDATAAALRAGLLMVAADGDGLAFVHDLVRQSLASRLTPERARATHRRLATALGTRAGVPAVRVAAHWDAAGPDEQAAAEAAVWWRRAAQESARLRAHEEAATQQLRAVRAAEAAHAPAVQLAQSWLETARAWYGAGQYAQAVAAAERASALAAEVDRPDLTAEAALAVGYVIYPEAQAVITRLTRSALDRGAALADHTRARLMAQQVAALGHFAEAKGATLASEAMTLARASGDPAALLEAIGAWMSAKPELGLAEEQRVLAEEAVLLASGLGQPVPELMAHTWRLNAVVQLGRVDQAGVELEALRVIAAQSKLPLATWHWLRATIAVAILRGEFDVVDDLHRRATAIARDSGDVVAANIGNATVIELARRRGVPLADPEKQLEALTRAPQSALVEAPRAAVLDDLGRRDEAFAIYQRLLPLLGSHTEYRPWWPVVYTLLELAERFGDAAAGALIAAEIEPYGRESVGGWGPAPSGTSATPIATSAGR